MHQIDTHFQTLSEGQHLLLNVIEDEYRQGMLLLNSIDKSVAVYGGSKILPDSQDYQEIQEIGRFFGQNGWYVVTGGGPGAMAAALAGSQQVGGKTAAFRINLEKEEPPVVKADIDFLCTQFSVRKYLLRQSDVFVVVPGGFGTLDELAEVLNLIKTDKYPRKHVFLYQKEFWKPFVEWLETKVCKEKGLASLESLSNFTVVDSVEELAEHLHTQPYFEIKNY